MSSLGGPTLKKKKKKKKLIFMLQGLTIKKVLPNHDPITFKKLWPRITNLIFSALQVETDPKNAQLLLGKESFLNDVTAISGSASRDGSEKCSAFVG